MEGSSPEAGNAPGEHRDQKGETDQKFQNSMLNYQECHVSNTVILEACFFFLRLVDAVIDWNRTP